MLVAGPGYPNGVPPHDSARALSELIERRCGVRIPKVDIEAMFMADWHKLSMFAHAIHNEQQRKLMQQAPAKDQRTGPSQDAIFWGLF